VSAAFGLQCIGGHWSHAIFLLYTVLVVAVVRVHVQSERAESLPL